MLEQIGGYYLGQEVAEAPDLSEMTSGTAPLQGGPPGQRLFEGHEVAFAGTMWATLISAVNGRVVRIAIQHMTSDRRESDSAFSKCLEYLLSELGKYQQHPFLSKKYRWEYQEGNVFLNRRKMFGFTGINLILTRYLD